VISQPAGARAAASPLAAMVARLRGLATGPRGAFLLSVAALLTPAALTGVLPLAASVSRPPPA